MKHKAMILPQVSIMLLQELSPMKKHQPLEQQYHAQSSGKRNYPAKSQSISISLSKENHRKNSMNKTVIDLKRCIYRA